MFSDMKPAERKLLEACQKGEILDLGNKSPTEKTAKNEIRGEFLRALILSNNQEIEESGKKYVLKIAPNGIIFSRVYVSGIFDFSFCSTDLKFSFRNSKFENRLDLSDSKIRFLSLIGSIVPSFDAFRLVCESDIFLKNGFEAHGKVNFGSAQIGSNLECSKGKFINKEGDALNCNSVKIGGSVFLRDGFEAHGKVNFGSAQIGSNLECSKGKFINKEGDALNCNSAKIDGAVFLKDGFEAHGKVNFGSAQIGSNLECSKGKFINKEGDALNCNSAKIDGAVFLKDGFEAHGKVNFGSAQIGSNLECSKGKFINKEGDALNCNSVKIGGSVFLRDSFDAKGKVNFHSCFIGKSLIFSKSNGISFFSLNSAQISRLSLDFEKVKKIDLNGCIYEHLDSIIFSKVLEKMPKEDDFKPQPYKQLAKVLRNMGHHNEADDVMIEYNNKIFNMDFKDFKERFKNRISVFFKEKRNFFKNLFKSFFEALGFLVRLIYGKTAGYGYKPMRVIFTMFVILLSCGWFYQKTADMGIFAPSNPLIFQNTKYDSNVNKCGIPKLIWKGSYIAYKDEQDIFYCEYKNIEKQENIKNDNWTTNQNLEGEYTTFSPYWYSLDIIIPIVDLQMDKDWGVFISPINSNITLNHVTRWIVWIEILFGWIYSLILVAILSGLAKNEKD